MGASRGKRWMRQLSSGLGLFALAMGTWLSFPTTSPPAPLLPALRVVLFDLSAGTSRLRPAHGIWARQRLREEALEAQARREVLSVGLYGADVRHLGEASAEDWLERLQGRGGEALALELEGAASLGSRLDDGLALFEDELSRAQRESSELVLYADEDYSGADPAPRLARLQQAGVSITWKPLSPPTQTDLGLEALRVPLEPAPGSPLVVDVDLALVTAGRTREAIEASWALELWIDLQTAEGLRERRLDLVLPAGPISNLETLRWNTRVELGPTPEGRSQVTARVRLQHLESGRGGDAIPENDLRSASLRSGDVLLVAAVAQANRLPELQAWIDRMLPLLPGIQVEVLEPRALVQRSGELDLLVSFDLSPQDLPNGWVESFVRQGGGWFFSAGWDSLPGWGEVSSTGTASEEDSPLGALLPLVLAPEDRSPRDVIFLVDGSGSMAGEAFNGVKRALARLALAVGSQDALSLRFFTGSLMAPIDLRVGQKGLTQTLEDLFESRVPGGPTAILYSLDQLVVERAQAERPALTFLLTDGQDDVSYDVRARGAAIAAGLNEGESRLVVIAAGERPDYQLLESLLAPGESLRLTTEVGELQELFQREVFRGRAREGESQMRWVSEGHQMTQSAELLAAWRNSAPPAYQRYLRCVPRPGADLLWASREHDEALLAWQRVGRGRVAAWASNVGQTWASQWNGAAELFGPLWRLLCTSSRELTQPTLQVESGQLRLSGVPTDWPAQIEAEFVAEIWGGRVGLPLGEESLGRQRLDPPMGKNFQDPRSERVAALPDCLGPSTSGKPLTVRLTDPSDGRLLGQVGLALPAPAEFERAAQLRVSRRSTTEANSEARARPSSPRAHPEAWIWLLVGALGVAGAALSGALERAGSGSASSREQVQGQG